MANCFLLLALQLKSKCLREAPVKENRLLTPSTPRCPFVLLKKRSLPHSLLHTPRSFFRDVLQTLTSTRYSVGLIALQLGGEYIPKSPKIGEHSRIYARGLLRNFLEEPPSIDRIADPL